ncbi:MAG: response regulator transcription factor [Sulfurovum sp.]|nr:response regulator transcription factor [Sulfurovum sp.]MCB4745196.1 response regulator transcription factor [Sulfurovum sp.]MCB4746582.1 response regulator transcription factor [Sulfurovum sp.]MCB4747987.1 response regulator transcription factor [Sulfurovum sp.]MCB4749748.1 response regulator transcription factor [Sulfurovum sp.]
MKILVMEDDPVLGEIIVDYLLEYYSVNRAFDANEAQGLIEKNHYDLLIFDINVPQKSGVELIRELRSFNNMTPAIIITAYDDLMYLKKSFDAGAHDYIKKPFELEELKLRIEKSKKLFCIEQEEVLSLDKKLVYYPSKRVISNGTQEWILSPKEKEILDYFIAHPHRPISFEELAQNIWEFDVMPSDATLRSYIRKLREIIGSKKIMTQRGIGYCYE